MKILNDELKDQIIKEVSLAISERRFDDVFAIAHTYLRNESEIDQKGILKNMILYLENQYWPVPLSDAIGGVMALADEVHDVVVPEQLLECGRAIIKGNEELLGKHIMSMPHKE